MRTTLIAHKRQIEQLAELFQQGMNAWAKAGELLVDMLDNSGLTLGEISTQTGLPARILGRFEQLGRKQLLPSLLIADYPASRYMSRLTYSEQERLTTESIEVLTADGTDKVLIATKNLTPDQCRQVFTSDDVRDLPAQRAWVESLKRKTQTRVIDAGMPYHIDRGQVVFDRACTMKASQLLNILAQLTPSK